MASQLETLQFLQEQMSGAGLITYRKMFGEYTMYCEGKVIALVCDDQLFLKQPPPRAPTWVTAWRKPRRTRDQSCIT
jgi:hypothetical protein